MIEAVIFDMDGVLIDAREWHYEAFNRAASLFGYEISPIEHDSIFDGLPTRRKLEILTEVRGLPAELQGFVNEMKQRYTMEIVHTRCKPVFTQEYALSRLKKEGYRVAVASNSIRDTVATMLQRAALIEYLEFFLSNEDVRAFKPDPEIYQLAMRRLGLAPSNCLIVEDNENGISAAKASGAYVMAVKGVEEVNYDNVMRVIGECQL